METMSPVKTLSQPTYPIGLLNQFILKISLRFGAKAKEVERFLKFAVVGIVGAFVDFGVLNLLQATLLRPEGADLQLRVALATGIAFTSAVTSNFIWNRYWTYPNSRTHPLHQQLIQFFVVNIIGLIFRLWFVRTLFHPLGGAGVDMLNALGLAGHSLDKTATSQLGTNIAQFFAVWIVMLWNYFVNRYWTYNDVK